MVGDEIVNVNGRRLRGLTMHEAKTVLRNCCQSRDVDIVVARREEGEGGADGRGARRGAPVAVPPSSSSSAAAAVPMAESAPLSLLAAHDEQDLINLVRKRPIISHIKFRLIHVLTFSELRSPPPRPIDLSPIFLLLRRGARTGAAAAAAAEVDHHQDRRRRKERDHQARELQQQ